MDASQVAALRALLKSTWWLEQTTSFARELRATARTPSGLLLVGTPDDEPWHLTAHLAEEARLARIPELEPTLLRWSPPPGARPHLAVGLDRLASAGRSETLLVVSAQPAPADLLERVHDVRRHGTTIFALDTDDPELDGLAHEALAVPPGVAPMSFDAAQHLVSAAAADPIQQPGLRSRLARLLHAISGPASG